MLLELSSVAKRATDATRVERCNQSESDLYESSKVRGKSPGGGRPHLAAMVQLCALPLDGLRGRFETVQGKALPFSCGQEAINDQPRKVLVPLGVIETRARTPLLYHKSINPPNRRL